MNSEALNTFIAVLLPTVLAGIGWLIKTLYADRKDRISRQTENAKFQLDVILGIKRLELLQLIQHCPEDARLICKEYDNYHDALHGNSYITDVFEEWKEKRELAHGDDPAGSPNRQDPHGRL
jgi:hypothetical protein